MSARAKRRALAFGSLARKGLIGARAGVGDATRGGGGGGEGAAPIGGTGGVMGRGAAGIAGVGRAAGGGAIGGVDGIDGIDDAAGVIGRAAKPDPRAGVAGGGTAGPPIGGVGIAGRVGGVKSGGRDSGGVGVRGDAVGAADAGGGNGARAGGIVGGAAAADAATENGAAGLGVGATIAGAGADVIDAGAAAAWCFGGPNSSSTEVPAPTVITPPHTEQRARTPEAGIFPGSTRKTDRHSGHETFTYFLPSPRSQIPAASPAPSLRSSARPFAGRWRTRSPAAFSRNSSFQSRARSPAPRV